MNRTALSSSFRLLAVLSFLLGGLAQGQTAPAAEAKPQGEAREQKYEHIVHEDAGSKIEEVRVGGQTQSITVQSKLGGEPYQIKPAQAGVPDKSGAAGKAMWNVGKF
ncbi:MAG: hypothetical protein RLZZ271_512 [Pseudomonadota bacterium]|jgi:hypothetical protein